METPLLGCVGLKVDRGISNALILLFCLHVTAVWVEGAAVRESRLLNFVRPERQLGEKLLDLKTFDTASAADGWLGRRLHQHQAYVEDEEEEQESGGKFPIRTATVGIIVVVLFVGVFIGFCYTCASVGTQQQYDVQDEAADDDEDLAALYLTKQRGMDDEFFSGEKDKEEEENEENGEGEDLSTVEPSAPEEEDEVEEKGEASEKEPSAPPEEHKSPEEDDTNASLYPQVPTYNESASYPQAPTSEHSASYLDTLTDAAPTYGYHDDSYSPHGDDSHDD